MRTVRLGEKRITSLIRTLDNENGDEENSRVDNPSSKDDIKRAMGVQSQRCNENN